MLSGTVDANGAIPEMEGLNSGMYVIRVLNGDGLRAASFVKQ